MDEFVNAVKALSSITDYEIIFKNIKKVRLKVKDRDCRDALVKVFRNNNYSVHSRWVDPCEYIVTIYNRKTK